MPPGTVVSRSREERQVLAAVGELEDVAEEGGGVGLFASLVSQLPCPRKVGEVLEVDMLVRDLG